ncbi:MAG: hypothetical protein IJB89_03295 [Akkermansia sp.]|nr:hypothetical protein [Akkermansia sp.]
MKKTLITLLALSGIAAADTSVMDTAVIGFTNFSSGVADYGTMVDDIIVNTTDSVTTLTGITFDTALSDTNTRDSFSITLVLDAAKIGSVSEFTSLAAAYYSESGTMGFGVDATGAIKGQWGTEAYNWSAGAMPTEGTITLTYVTGNYTGTSEGSRLYVGDAATYYSKNELKTGNTDYNTIKINNLGGAIKQGVLREAGRCHSGETLSGGGELLP